MRRWGVQGVRRGGLKSGDTLLVFLFHWPEDRVLPRVLLSAPSRVVPDR